MMKNLVLCLNYDKVTIVKIKLNIFCFKDGIMKMNFKDQKDSVLKLMINKLLMLVAFLFEVIKHKDEQLKDKYNLVDWVEKKGIWYCRIQVIGTSIVQDYTPESILKDDDFINGFSRIDGRTITNLANYEKYRSKYQIKSIRHEDGLIQIVDSGKDKMIKIDNSLQDSIEEFSKIDAFNLGRAVGEKDILIE